MHGTAQPDAPKDGGVPKRKAYPVPEVAELLGGVSERYVWDLIASGELESFKSGQRRLVPDEAVDAYIQRKRDDEARLRAMAASA